MIFVVIRSGFWGMGNESDGDEIIGIFKERKDAENLLSLERKENPRVEVIIEEHELK